MSGPAWTFKANDGVVWRNSHAPHFTMNNMDSATCERLLAVFERQAADTSDWFHTRAAELAAELRAAITEARDQLRAAQQMDRAA